MNTLSNDIINSDTLEALAIPLEVDAALYVKQLDIELYIHDKAVETFKANLEKSITSGVGDETATGMSVMSKAIPLVAEGITEWLEANKNKSAGRKHLAIKPLTDVADTRIIAALALSTMLSHVMKEDSYLTGTAFQIAMKLEDELTLIEAREHDKTLYKKLASAAKNKGEYRKKKDAVAYTARTNNFAVTKWSRNARLSVGTLLLEIIRDVTGLIKIEALAEYSTSKHKTETPYTVALTEEAAEQLSKYNSKRASFDSTYLPMIVPPIDWTKGMVRGGGYLSSHVTPLRLVKTHSHRTLNEYKHSDMPVVLNAINAAQRTPWRINKKVLELLKIIGNTGVKLKKLNLHMPELLQKPDDIAQLAEAYKAKREHQAYEEQMKDYQAGDPLPTQPTVTYPHWFEGEAEKRYIDYRKRSTAIYKQRERVKSYILNHSSIVETAEMFKDFENIYMPYTTDFRGRLYCASILSPQGADHVKAVLQFAKPVKIGVNGIKWLKLHAANLMGDDKAPFDERIKWAEDNWQEMLACARDPLEYRMWSTADKPFQAYATCLEILGVEENGADHICRMPIALDGSCSGTQLFSAMLRDEVGGMAVNLIPCDRPQDIYTMVKDKVQEAMNRDCLLMTDDLIDQWLDGANEAERVYKKEAIREQIRVDVYTYWMDTQSVTKRLGKTKMQEVRECARYASRAYHSKQWMKFGINRNTAKRPVMTFSYGAKKQGFKDQLMDDILAPAFNKHVEKYGDAVKGINDWCFDGRGYSATEYMAGLLWNGVSQTVLKAAQMMAWMQKVASLIVKSGLPVTYTNPLGFRVVQDYRKTGDRRVMLAFAGKTIMLSTNAYKKGTKFVDNDWEADVDKMKSAAGISPNVIHSLDSTLLMMIVDAAAKEGIDAFALIHDSFGTYAGVTERFYHIIREQFIRLFTEWDIVEHLAVQLIDQVPDEFKTEIPPLPSKGSLDIQAVAKSVYCFL